jgi:hypothetical protein
MMAQDAIDIGWPERAVRSGDEPVIELLGDRPCDLLWWYLAKTRVAALAGSSQIRNDADWMPEVTGKVETPRILEPHEFRDAKEVEVGGFQLVDIGQSELELRGTAAIA